jgi:hypothetical protein
MATATAAPEAKTSPWMDSKGKPIAKGATVEHPASKLVGEADYRWTKNLDAKGKATGKATASTTKVRMIGVIPNSSEATTAIAEALGRQANHISLPANELVVKKEPTPKEKD